MASPFVNTESISTEWIVPTVLYACMFIVKLDGLEYELSVFLRSGVTQFDSSLEDVILPLLTIVTVTN